MESFNFEGLKTLGKNINDEKLNEYNKKLYEYYIDYMSLITELRCNVFEITVFLYLLIKHFQREKFLQQSGLNYKFNGFNLSKYIFDNLPAIDLIKVERLTQKIVNIEKAHEFINTLFILVQDYIEKRNNKEDKKSYMNIEIVINEALKQSLYREAKK